MRVVASPGQSQVAALNLTALDIRPAIGGCREEEEEEGKLPLFMPCFTDVRIDPHMSSLYFWSFY